LNPDLKKCIIHHILLIWYQVITICFQIKKKRLHGLRFSTDDELKYATEEWQKEQSNFFALQASKNSEIDIKCTVTKAVKLLYFSGEFCIFKVKSLRRIITQ